MSHAQIARIKKISDFRVFQNWNDEGRPDAFGRVNLIYGTNGSGKSTLATMLRACAVNAVEIARAGIEIDVSIGGEASVVSERSAHFWERVRVFNADYVRENLRFDDSDGPRSDSLLTLGKANVDAEKELEEAEARRAEIEPQAVAGRATVKSAQTALQQRMTAIAALVVEDLRTSPVATYRGTNTYTRSNVRALLTGDRSVFDAQSTDVAADRHLATSAAPSPAPSIVLPRFPTADFVVDRALELLTTDVTSVAISDLADHPARAKWVQDGLDLHVERDCCLFCGNTLTEARRVALAAHFDRSLTDLQTHIDAHLVALKQAGDDARKLAESLPGDGDLYPDLAGKLRSARSEIRDQVDRFRSSLRVISDALTEKRNNPFGRASVDLPSIALPDPQAILALMAEHERRRDTHTNTAASAARRVELARVRAFIPEYDASAEALGVQEKALADLERELTQLSSRIIALSNIEADPVPQAAELTSSVTRLLGRSELAFAPSEDGKQYRIERSGSPATHLSEGERTAIALLHFLASIREGVITGDEPIIVIDDPVSSMDDGILFGVSSFLWSTLVENTHASQVFLLTHNFELFRQWVMQLESARRYVAGGYTIHEIRMRHRARGHSAPRRLPQLDPWTTDRRQSNRLRSLYHFLFSRVATALLAATPEVSLAERMDLLALAPNAARKMVEAFLSFRFPQYIGDFHGGMKAAIAEVHDPAIRTHVERYLHAYSHNEEGNISAIVDPSEATVVLRSLFSMMRENDQKHFSAMCSALGIDEEALFALPG